jgi:acyl-CoA thioester hydrolase
MPHPVQTWPDLAGRISTENGQRQHVLPVRVYFEDTDFSGLVYHGSYVRWCERGRSDFLRLLGVHHSTLIDAAEPAAFVVRRLTLDYLKPARIDDILEVRTSVNALGAAAMTLKQTISRDGVALCHAEVMVVLVTPSGRVQRLSRALKDVVQSNP